MKFPQTVAACKDSQKSLWAIGDALRVECPIGKSGVKDKSHDLIKDAAKEVAEHCGKAAYSLGMLRKLRSTAKEFQGANRLAPVSWTVHDIAGSPEKLTAIIDAAKKAEVDVSASFARKQMKLRNKLPPRPKAATKKKRDLAAHDLYDSIQIKQFEAISAAEEAVKLAKDAAERLFPKGIEVCLSRCVEVINAWQKVAQALRKGQDRPTTQTKLLVVGGDDEAA
jgi:hypothetical protein